MALDFFFFFSSNLCKFSGGGSSLSRMNKNAQNLRWDVNSWQRSGKAQMGNSCGLCPTLKPSPTEDGSACISLDLHLMQILDRICKCRVSSNMYEVHTFHLPNSILAYSTPFWHMGPASQKQLTLDCASG